MAETNISPAERLKALNQVLAQRMDENLALPADKRFMQPSDLIGLAGNGWNFSEAQRPLLAEAVMKAKQQASVPQAQLSIMTRALRTAMDAMVTDKTFSDDAAKVIRLQEHIDLWDGGVDAKQLEALVRTAAKNPAAKLPALPDAPKGLEVISSTERLKALNQVLAQRLDENLTLPADKRFMEPSDLIGLAGNGWNFPEAQRPLLAKAVTEARQQVSAPEAQLNIMTRALRTAMDATTRDKGFAEDTTKVVRLQEHIDLWDGGVDAQGLETIVRAAAKNPAAKLPALPDAPKELEVISPAERLKALNQLLAQRLDENLTLPADKRFMQPSDLIGLAGNGWNFPEAQRPLLAEAVMEAEQQASAPQAQLNIMTRALRKAMDATVTDKTFSDDAARVIKLQEHIDLWDGGVDAKQLETLVRAAAKNPAAKLPALPDAPKGLEIISSTERLKALNQVLAQRLDENLTLPADKRFMQPSDLIGLGGNGWNFPETQRSLLAKAVTETRQQVNNPEMQLRTMTRALRTAMDATVEDKAFAEDTTKVMKLQKNIDLWDGGVDAHGLETLVRAAMKAPAAKLPPLPESSSEAEKKAAEEKKAADAKAIADKAALEKKVADAKAAAEKAALAKKAADKATDKKIADEKIAAAKKAGDAKKPTAKPEPKKKPVAALPLKPAPQTETAKPIVTAPKKKGLLDHLSGNKGMGILGSIGALIGSFFGPIGAIIVGLLGALVGAVVDGKAGALGLGASGDNPPAVPAMTPKLLKEVTAYAELRYGAADQAKVKQFVERYAGMVAKNMTPEAQDKRAGEIMAENVEVDRLIKTKAMQSALNTIKEADKNVLRLADKDLAPISNPAIIAPKAQQVSPGR